MNDIRNIDLNLLHAFDTLFQARSVTRAAEQLAVTQPAVSGMLARLRDAFDDPLFVRTQHGVLPTPRAEELIPRVRDVLESVRSLVEATPFDPATAERTFSIAANDYMQEAILVPLIEELRRSAPGIKLAIKPPAEEDLARMLSGGELDLALGVPEMVDPRLRRTVLYAERYVCVGRKAHPLPVGKIGMEDYCAQDHLIVSPTRGSFSGASDEVLRSLGVRRNVVLSLPGFQILMTALQSDDFLALIPERLLAKWRSKVKVYEPPFQVPNFDVIQCWHQVNDADPANRWLRALILDIASSEKLRATSAD